MPSSLLSPFTLGPDGKEREVKEKHVQKQGESKGFSLWSALCERGGGESGIIVFSSSSYNSILCVTAIAFFFT